MGTIMNRSTNHAFSHALAPVVPLALAALLGACTGEQGGATKTTGEPSV